MTIPELLEIRANEQAGRTFLFCDEEEYSHALLNERACNVAANLAKQGVGEGDKVVLLMGNCVEFLYCLFGLGRIGAVLVPVNPLLKPDEIAYIINNAEANTLVTIPEFVPMLPMVKAALPRIERIYVLGDEAPEGAEPFNVLLEPAESISEIVATEDSDAALIYTSGTTGMPKGVELTHRNYIWNARMMTLTNDIGAQDRFLCVLPLFHVNAQVVTILTPLLAKAQVVLMAKFNIFGILPMIEEYKTTIMSGVPTIYAMICGMPKASKYDISSMRFFVSGAAPMPEDTYLATQRVLKKPLIMGYGLSEATCASVVADHKDPIKWDSVGPALRYTPLRIVNEDGVDIPIGQIGEILVSGPAVMKGYYKNPEATAEVLKDGWLKTGDLGRLDEDGYVFIVGRLKDMIIRGGQNIYPVQVENILSTMPGIEEVAVVGVEEARWGQQVLAVVKVAEDQELTEEKVIEFSHENLAAYKCPEYVRFVDELPKTPTGKIKKNLVAEQFADIAKRAPRSGA
ncbi:MAG: long-chain-fatty-acid--CoA ligase [Nitrospiraceae bacterium]|nr:long-chain-fatty-acid--CoA ligase [Nitrospiraceae bacterium]